MQCCLASKNARGEKSRGKEKKIEGKKKTHQGINNYINALCSKAWRLLSSLSWSLNSEQTGCVLADKSKYLLNYRIRQMKLLLHQSGMKRPRVAVLSWLQGADKGLSLLWEAQAFQKPGSNVSFGCSEAEREAVLQLWVGFVAVFEGILFIEQWCFSLCPFLQVPKVTALKTKSPSHQKTRILCISIFFFFCLVVLLTTTITKIVPKWSNTQDTWWEGQGTKEVFEELKCH